MPDLKEDSRSSLERFYYEMLRIRRVEEKLIELFNTGRIKAPIHLSIGQEAVAVGVMAALRPQDKIVSTHRCHAHYLAKGGDLKKMMAELLGKTTGLASGRAGTMHLFDDEAGLVISVPLVGASIAFAVGMALSFKIKGEDKIAAAFFGDGAIEQGIFWESLNFASVHCLPILFVCENNLYATHSRLSRRQPSEDILPRIKPFGITTGKVDGNNVIEVFGASGLVIRGIKQVHQPGFIEAKTYRIKEHWGASEDWHLGYRTEAEGDDWRKRCPIKCLKEVLLEEGSLTDALRIESVYEEKIRNEIEKAVKFAIESPEPVLEDLM